MPDLAYYLIGDPFRSAYLADPYFQNLGAEGAVFQFVIVRPGQDPEVESTFRVESGGAEQPLFRRGAAPALLDAAPVGPTPASFSDNATAPEDAAAPEDTTAPNNAAAPPAAVAPGEPVSARDAASPTESPAEADGASGEESNGAPDDDATWAAAAALVAGVPIRSRAAARWRRRRDAAVRAMAGYSLGAHRLTVPDRAGSPELNGSPDLNGPNGIARSVKTGGPVMPAGGVSAASDSPGSVGGELAGGGRPVTLGRSARRARRLAATR